MKKTIGFIFLDFRLNFGSVRYFVLFLTLCLILFSGCKKKRCIGPVADPVDLELRFDWSDSEEGIPEIAGMLTFFYPHDEATSLQRFSFRGTEGGGIRLSLGLHDVIAYSHSDKVVFGDIYNFTTHHITTREGKLFEPVGLLSYDETTVVKADGCDEEPIIMAPEKIWCNVSPSVEIATVRSSLTTDTIHLRPRRITPVCEVEIVGVENIKEVMRACMSVSGMSAGMNLATLTSKPGRATIPFEGSIDVANERISGQLTSFGHSGEYCRQRLMLYVWTRDGNCYAFGNGNDKFDLTDSLRYLGIGNDIKITLEGLTIPPSKNTEGTGGYHPGVDDRPVEIIEIRL